MPRLRRSFSRLGIVLVLTASLTALGAWGTESSRAATPKTRPPATGNPLRLHRTLYVDRGSSAANAARQLAAQGRPQDAALIRWLAAQPTGVWLAGGPGSLARAQRTLDAAAAAHTVPVLVAYDIPGRDCGGYSANNAVTAAEYQAWVRAVASMIGKQPVVVILEPDAVAHALSGCVPQDKVGERLGLLAFAVRTLKGNPNAAVYVDAGNAGWITPVDKLASPLRAAGVAEADGFSLNVSSFYDTTSTIRYGTDLSRRLGGVHFVVDTGRNGNGAAPPQADGSPKWCNPPGRAVGRQPTTRTGLGLVDAFLWVKPPGNSDGACRPGEPSAGQWWTDYALQLVRGRRTAG